MGRSYNTLCQWGPSLSNIKVTQVDPCNLFLGSYLEEVRWSKTELQLKPTKIVILPKVCKIIDPKWAGMGANANGHIVINERPLMAEGNFLQHFQKLKNFKASHPPCEITPRVTGLTLLLFFLVKFKFIGVLRGWSLNWTRVIDFFLSLTLPGNLALEDGLFYLMAQ